MIIKKKLLYVGLAGWMLLSGITLVGCRENGMILETTEQNTGSQNDTAYAEDVVVGSVTERNQEDTEAIKDTGVCVFVCGAVKQEGVYELPIGARINDALLAAGGFAENAAEQVVNLADFIGMDRGFIFRQRKRCRSSRNAGRIRKQKRTDRQWKRE